MPSDQLRTFNPNDSTNWLDDLTSLVQNPNGQEILLANASMVLAVRPDLLSNMVTIFPDLADELTAFIEVNEQF